jgi:alpha-amylase
MGVIYQAHARFLDARGNRITVPAPVDPGAGHVPWWFDWIAAHAAPLKRTGFTALLYPPVCKTQGGNSPAADGYGVYDQYDLGSKQQCGSVETRFGSRERLARSIAMAHAAGLDVYVDVVMHQLDGGFGGTYEYLGANSSPRSGRFPKHPGCFRGPPPGRPQDPVPAPPDDFAFGDELVYVNCDPPRYTIDGMIGFGDWMTRSLDVQGFRVDDVKGMAVAFVREWMTSAAMASRFCVSEYFDGNPGNLDGWAHASAMQGRSAVFDFPLHWALQSMCDDSGFDMRGMQGRAYASRDPFGAVTFVDNPDTDLSAGQSIITNKLLAYAFILTSEGYPCVYHKDYADEPGCYALGKSIDTLVWIHETLANGPTLWRWADPRVIVYERLWAPGLLTAIGNDGAPRTVTCQTAFGPGVVLHDYTGHHGDITTDGAGNATFTVPSNANGAGQSYLCFSREGLSRPIELAPRTTTQTLFGAPDLDIPPARAHARVTAGRVFCAAGKPVTAAVRSAASLQLSALAPDGTRVVAESGHDLQFTPKALGWQAIEVAAGDLAGPASYEVEVRYTAPDSAML